MIIWVDDELFTGNSRSTDLLCLLRNAATRRHTLLISNDPDSAGYNCESPHFFEWQKNLTDTLDWEVNLLCEKLSRVTVNSVTRGRSKRVLVSERTLGHHHSICLSLNDAVRAVSLPLHILVENQINDSSFLRRAMPSDWRKRITDWEKRGEIRFIQGGGITEIKKLIAVHAGDDDYAKLSFGLPADVWRQLHFVIYDHDGNTQQQPSGESNGVFRECDNNGMNTHQHRLERRKQENYLPVEALRAINFTDQESPTAIDEFFTKTAEERHFSDPPGCFKNQFKEQEASLSWSDSWFEKDGSWPEMIRLAEKIASAM